jgi:hypothetical protein
MDATGTFRAKEGGFVVLEITFISGLCGTVLAEF